MPCTNKVMTLDFKTLEPINVPCGTDTLLCPRCKKMQRSHSIQRMVREEQGFVGFVTSQVKTTRRTMADARRAERSLKRRLGEDY